MKIIEIEGDLFTCDNKISLAHCVSADFRMGVGIALKFKTWFGSMLQLKKQNIEPGSVAYINMDQRTVFYLVTKKNYWNKPTILNFTNSIRALKQELIKLKISKIAMPKIGCGLDKLNWPIVREIIKKVFEDTEIEIIIYYLK